MVLTQHKGFGYIIVFKPVLVSSYKTDKAKESHIKGNVDAELVLHTVIEMNNYDKALIISGDGDFYCLIKYLYNQRKLLKLLVPNSKKYSQLLKSVAPNKLDFMNNLKNKLAYNKKRQLHGD